MAKHSTENGGKAVPNAKSKGGRPPFNPTSEQRYSVSLMAAIGIPSKAISEAVGISRMTLRKHFRDELAVGKVRTITKVADSLVRQALAGNITAAIFFLKTQARWTETHRVEVAKGDPRELTDDELEAALSDAGLTD